MNSVKLKELGLSTYESKCYIALLQYGDLLGKDLADKSGVPPTSIYRNIASLEKKGFINIIQQDPYQYQAVRPEVAIASAIGKQKQSLELLEKQAIEELQEIRSEENNRKEKPLEVYTGRKQSYAIGKQLIEQAQKEVLLLGRGANQSLIDLSQTLKTARKRDVHIRFLVTEQQNDTLLEEIRRYGVHVRKIPPVGFSLLIVDGARSQLVIKTELAKQGRFALKILSKDLSEAHKEYFLTVWKRAIPL